MATGKIDSIIDKDAITSEMKWLTGVIEDGPLTKSQVIEAINALTPLVVERHFSPSPKMSQKAEEKIIELIAKL